jgi:hypothetical protein
MKSINSMRILVAALCVIILIGIAGCGGTETETTVETISKDGINITSVSPDKDLVDGVNTTFTVVVRYTLASTNSGELMIGFNTQEVGSFGMISSASKIVSKGTGEYKFIVKATVKDWGEEGDFEVYVNLSENPHPNSWSPLATDLKILYLR